MTSQLKSDTARANGAKSRGPKSPETRQKSSRNSLKHGLTACRTVLLDCESTEEFQKLHDEFVAAHQPANPAEQDLVDQMAVMRWRIRRMWAAEVAVIDCEMVRQKPETEKQFLNPDPAVHVGQAIRSLADESNSLALMSRYESRLQRTYERAYRTLRELQATRTAAEKNPRNEPETPSKTCLDVIDSEKVGRTPSSAAGPPAGFFEPQQILPLEGATPAAGQGDQLRAMHPPLLDNRIEQG